MEPSIYNCIDIFKLFYYEAVDKELDKQINIWDNIMEKREPIWKYFYENIVWEQHRYSEIDFKNRKQKLLHYMIPKILDKENYNLILDNLIDFEKQLQKCIVKFKQLIPGFIIKGSIFAGITCASFDGKSSEGGELGPNGEIILAFGIDTITLSNEQIDIIFSHELFHFYQCNILNLPKYEYSKLSRPLWFEGLATYATKKLFPEYDNGKILLDNSLGNLSNADIIFLANEFLKDIEKPAIDKKAPKYMENGLYMVNGK